MIFKPTIFTAEEDGQNFLFAQQMKLPTEFGKYSRFYNIATETVKDYVSSMSENYETVLTVGGSGDQGIALNQKGAKDIYFFDINRADYYYLILRKYALMYLKRKDFLDFMIAEDNQAIMNYKLYKKLENVLPKPVKLFWDMIYDKFNYQNNLMAYYLFRSPKGHAKKSRIINNYYENNETYYNTQSKVKESNWYFIESDFYDLDKNLPEGINFDAIILSNIYEYLNFGHKVNTKNASKYVQFIKNILLPRLKNNGSCLLSYLYKYNDKIDNFINLSLKEQPNGWANTDDMIGGLDNIEKYFTGYTSQNVAYHFLLQELNKELIYQKVYTACAGYGMSSSNNDWALVYKKTLQK